MSTREFERELLADRRIPLAEASSYFISIRKEASDSRSNGEIASERGVRSAYADLVKRDVQAPYRTGERVSDVVGRLGGAVLGGYLGHAGAKNNRALSAAAGALVGQHLGGHVGRAVGRESDIRKFRNDFHKKASMVAVTSVLEPPRKESDLVGKPAKTVLRKEVPEMSKKAMFKIALDAMGVESAPQEPDEPVMEQQAVDPKAIMELLRERSGMLAEKTVESEHYRQQAAMATRQAAAAQQQAAMATQQAQQAEQQIGQSMQQAQQAQMAAQQTSQQAIAAAGTAQQAAAQAQSQQLSSMNEALTYRTLASNMRRGVLEMKQRVTEAVQQDPTNEADAALVMPQAPGMQPGMSPEAAQMQPEAMPPEAAQPQPDAGMPPEKVAGVMDTLRASAPFAGALIKERAPYALAGGALAAGATLYGAGSHAVRDRAALAELQARDDKDSFRTSMQIAKTKMQLAVNEFADRSPYAAASIAGAQGAITGAVAGPSIVKNVRKGYALLKGQS